MKTQRQALITAFIQERNLTTITAFKLTGSMKLPSRVAEFEEMGLKFKKEPSVFKTRYGTSGRFTSYTLVNKSDAKKLLKGMQVKKK